MYLLSFDFDKLNIKFVPSNRLKRTQVEIYLYCIGNVAWRIGSVRASGTEGSEFEPSFCHSFLCGGSLAGPCNPMRLGHDCYSTQVRSAISCIRKGKNEVIRVPKEGSKEPLGSKATVPFG